MKDNGRYNYQDTENGKIITFERGCMVDVDVLFNEIFGSAFLQHKDVFLDHGKPTDFQKNTVVKISKKLVVEIKNVKKQIKKT